MKTRLIPLFLIILAMSAFLPTPARADGIIIPELPCDLIRCPPPPCPGPIPCPPPRPSVQLVIRSHRVTVAIKDQIAVTHVDQVFYNPNNWSVEGTYLFPLPLEAAVTAFVLWVDGKPVEGQILDAEQARQKYQEIVSSLRDPALLEYAGRGAVQAQIFPIPPQGERRIELEYTQALAAENGLVRYIYPLNTEKFSAWPLEEVSISVDVQSSLPIRAAYSPTHNISLNRESENHVRAGYEDSQVLPDADFALYYSLGEGQAFHLLTYRDPGDASDPDGFFLALLAPRPDAGAQTLAKDIILVLDRSGSMDGEKFRQAQEALKYILGHLNAEDRFDIITFSTSINIFATQLVPAAQTDEAIQWVDQLSAQGSTDINRALLESSALVERGRPAYLIFLTDGLPTEGVVDSQRILDNLKGAAPDNLRLFVFGVGYDVDTFLLDSLAQAHHGTAAYVLPDERLDEVLSAFYTKISAPVLTNLSLDFGDIRVYDLYPSPLPDLFSGSQIILVGRYRQPGATTVTLTGQVNNLTQSFTFPEQTFASQSTINDQQSVIPRLWATRKIGYLLNQIRLKGPDQETIGQIVKLSIRYGIVTPYTSYLVTETLPLGAAEQERIVSEQFSQSQATAMAPTSGQAAVQKAADQGTLAGAGAPVAPSGESSRRVRIAGAKTFVFDGSKWIDTTFDPQSMTTVKVTFLSQDYFTLAGIYPVIASAFALGQQVIVIFNDVAYEVVPEGSDTPSVVIPPTQTTLSTTQPTSSIPVTAASQTPPDATTSLPQAPSRGFPCASGLLVLFLVWGWLALRR